MVLATHKFNKIDDSSFVEGSSKHGGTQPNYLIDSSNEVFMPLFDYIADSFCAALHAKEVTSVIFDGLITKMNLFPNFHAPKEEWEAIKKPLSAIITLQQLNELFSKKVKEIPDLKSTWDFAETNNIPLYIGGGVSLEKVLISPAQIIGPFSALEDYRIGAMTLIKLNFGRFLGFESAAS